MSLATTIDALLAFIDAHKAIPIEQNRRFDVEQFEALDMAVYVEADKLNRLDQLPQRDASYFNVPVAFLGRTNLPGNWSIGEPQFSPIVTRQWRNDMLALRALAEAQNTPAAQGKSAKSVLSLDARALAIFIEQPHLTKVAIAHLLGCNEKSLTPNRCPKLAAAIGAYKATELSHGSKDAAGNLEAWDE